MLRSNDTVIVRRAHNDDVCGLGETMRNTTAIIIAGSAVAIAAIAGGRFGPTPAHPRTTVWYARLRKSPLTPPGPAFAATWAVIDGLLWYGGARLMAQRSHSGRNAALGFWALNVLGVGGFSWVLFGRKRLDEALGVTAGMVGTSFGLVATAAVVDRKVAIASAPLATWVAFAFFLQEELWRRN
jgi:benzodiazapine receptor